MIDCKCVYLCTVPVLCFWYLEFGIWYAREISQCGEWILVAVHQFREIFSFCHVFELQVFLENSTVVGSVVLGISYLLSVFLFTCYFLEAAFDKFQIAET